jgi:hypothetical protein
MATNSMEMCSKCNAVMFICSCPKERFKVVKNQKYHGITSEQLLAPVSKKDLQKSIWFEDRRKVRARAPRDPVGAPCQVTQAARVEGFWLGDTDDTSATDAVPFAPTKPNDNVY